MNEKDMSRYPLPKDATFLPEVQELKLGTWLPMKYDAEMTRHGVRWLRVYGGMGDRFDREDWVADLSVCISIHDYQWNGSSFGADHGTMDNACYEELRSGLRYAIQEKEKAEKRLGELNHTIDLLKAKVQL